MDTTNGVPLRISPDGLKDTIVHVHFATDYNYSKLDQVLKETLDKIRSDSFNSYPVGRAERNLKENSSDTENKRLFYSDGISKILIDGNTISFNSVNGYTGWNNYRNLINGVLLGLNEFTTYNSLMIRYISVFEEQSIVKALDGDITLNQLEIFNGSTFSFNCHAASDKHEAEVIVRLTENIKTPNGLASISDILVSSIITEEMSFDSVIEQLDYIHATEKDVFFKLLKRSFVESLNPVWPDECK